VVASSKSYLWSWTPFNGKIIASAEICGMDADLHRNKNMEKIKEYKGIIILILVVLGGAFYWYEWRPTQIRKICFNAVLSASAGTTEQLYNNCLGIHGLKK